MSNAELLAEMQDVLNRVTPDLRGRLNILMESMYDRGWDGGAGTSGVDFQVALDGNTLLMHSQETGWVRLPGS